jgi:2'-5' RNA ligase
VGELLAALPRPAVPGLRWTTPEQWHVTLRFLGSCPRAAAVAAFEGLSLAGPVEAVLGPATGRFGRSVLHVPVAGVEGLAAAVSGLPSPEADRPFRGHLTLARARDRRGTDLAGLGLVGMAVAARWPVGAVTLVESHLGRGPARYEVVARRVLEPNTRL